MCLKDGFLLKRDRFHLPRPRTLSQTSHTSNGCRTGYRETARSQQPSSHLPARVAFCYGGNDGSTTENEGRDEPATGRGRRL